MGLLIVASDILKVLTYAQQSRERSNCELAALTERMKEFKRQIDQESRLASNGAHSSPNGDGIQAIGRSSHKMIEAVMQSAAKGKVTSPPSDGFMVLYLIKFWRFSLFLDGSF